MNILWKWDKKIMVKPLEGKDEKEITLNQESLTILRYCDLTSLPKVTTFL